MPSSLSIHSTQSTASQRKSPRGRQESFGKESRSRACYCGFVYQLSIDLLISVKCLSFFYQTPAGVFFNWSTPIFSIEKENEVQPFRSFSRIFRIPHFVGWNCIFLVVLKLERINEEESHIFQKTCPSPVRPQEKICNWTRWTIVQREGRLASVTLWEREVKNWIKIEKNFSDLCAPLYV